MEFKASIRELKHQTFLIDERYGWPRRTGSGTRFTRQKQIIKSKPTWNHHEQWQNNLFEIVCQRFYFFLTKKTWFHRKNFYFCMTNTLWRIDILNSASRILQLNADRTTWKLTLKDINTTPKNSKQYDQHCSILLAEFNMSTFHFGDQVFIDPTFSGIFVCGPLQSFVVNVCTLWRSQNLNLWFQPENPRFQVPDRSWRTWHAWHALWLSYCKNTSGWRRWYQEHLVLKFLIRDLRQRRFWATHVDKKWDPFHFKMTWQCQICV